MVSATKDPLTFDELMATPIDFSKYAMNRLKIDNLTQAHLVGPVYELLKGTCTSSIELEYNREECFKALIEKLDWNNPEGDRFPFDLTKPLPLKGRPGRLTVAAEYFFNNDLEFLKSSDLEKRSQLNKFSKHKVYSTQKILSVVSVNVKKLHGYGHLEEIMVRRADHQLYKFKEGDFVDLHLNDIEDMHLLAVQHKLFQLNKTFLGIKFKELDTSSFDPPRVICEDLNKQKRVMRADKLYKLSDRTLKTVRDELHHRLLDFQLVYNDDMPRRKCTAVDKRRLGLMVDLIDTQMLERRIIRNLERLMGARELEMDYRLMRSIKCSLGLISNLIL
nr:hypothetical protein [Tanacetum cinerariifolium]